MFLLNSDSTQMEIPGEPMPNFFSPARLSSAPIFQFFWGPAGALLKFSIFLAIFEDLAKISHFLAGALYDI